MKVELSAEVQVRRVAVFAEMAWMERRPELGLVCRAAREHSHRIVRATVQLVLPGLSDAGADNVIAWCKTLRLCDQHGALTSLGEQVAEHGEAPVPEQGVYDLWWIEHPVTGARLLSAVRVSSDRTGHSGAAPFDFRPGERVFRSVVFPEQRFVLRGLPSNSGQPAGQAHPTRATCRLRWTLDFDQQRDQWRLDGVIEGPPNNGTPQLQTMHHDPESGGLDLWNLAATWALGPLAPFGRWREDQRLLEVSFESLAATERQTFRKTLDLPSVEVPGKGTYSNVRLTDVPVGPLSDEDAQRWAMARLDEDLGASPGYRSRAALRERFAELTEGTPLEPRAPTLPAHAELMEGAWKLPERGWALAAPVDLAPYPLRPEELAPLRIGTPESSAIPESSEILRVPYRGGWSMRRLVERLLAGSSPRKLLLCDRYVRGEDNLETLRLLVAALRGQEPKATVEVWTSDEGNADLPAIQRITGVEPKSYRRAFGKQPPHDRYLLVLPIQGKSFGWHLSNSPLHARTELSQASPESPLRWKDLLGTRVAADQLEPALRQWFEEARR